MSSLSRDDVANLARLARIEMSEAELENFSNEFGVIKNGKRYTIPRGDGILQREIL